MNSVDDVERIHARSVHVHSDCWLLAGDGRVVEDKAARRLLGRYLRPTDSLESNGVVTARRSSRRGTIVVPAVGRRRGILWVSEELKSLGKDLLGDGEDAVLQMPHVRKSSCETMKLNIL